jgi:integrase
MIQTSSSEENLLERVRLFCTLNEALFSAFYSWVPQMVAQMLDHGLKYSSTMTYVKTLRNYWFREDVREQGFWGTKIEVLEMSNVRVCNLLLKRLSYEGRHEKVNRAPRLNDVSTFVAVLQQLSPSFRLVAELCYAACFRYSDLRDIRPVQVSFDKLTIRIELVGGGGKNRRTRSDRVIQPIALSTVSVDSIALLRKFAQLRSLETPLEDFLQVSYELCRTEFGNVTPRCSTYSFRTLGIRCVIEQHTSNNQTDWPRVAVRTMHHCVRTLRAYYDTLPIDEEGCAVSESDSEAELPPSKGARSVAKKSASTKRSATTKRSRPQKVAKTKATPVTSKGQKRKK